MLRLYRARMPWRTDSCLTEPPHVHYGTELDYRGTVHVVVWWHCPACQLERRTWEHRPTLTIYRAFQALSMHLERSERHGG